LGTSTRPATIGALRSPRNVTFTPMSGRMRGSSRSKAARTFTVAFCRSAVGITVRTLAGICQSG
jgi:hypothetical protein